MTGSSAGVDGRVHDGFDQSAVSRNARATSFAYSLSLKRDGRR